MRKVAVVTMILIGIMTLCTVSEDPIYVRAQENIITSASITVSPNPVQVGDSVVINIQIDPPPPLPTDRIDNISVTYISPEGVATKEPYNTVYTPTSIGNWTIQVNFNGQTFANGTIYYMPSQNQTALIALPIPSPEVAGFWTQKVLMPTARYGMGVAVVDGKIYAIGGEGATGVLGTNEMYDPATNTWTTKAPMPTPRLGFAATVFQNMIYCIGGDNSTAAIKVNEVYNPQTDTWETKASMPIPEDYIVGNVVNGEIYIINGGLNQVYDPTNDTWTTKAPLPTPTIFSASAVLDKQIYIIGGSNGGDSDSGNYAVNLTQIYDPQTDTWTTGAAIPENFALVVGTGTAGSTTGVLAPKEIVVIGGGYDIDSYPLIASNEVQIYNPKNNSWSTGAPMPTSRELPAVAVVNDTFYAIGGGLPFSNQVSNANEQYTPAGYGTPDPSYQAPTASPAPSVSALPSPSSTSAPPSPNPTLTATPTAPTNTSQPTLTAAPTQPSAALTPTPPASFTAESGIAVTAVVVVALAVLATVALRRGRKRQIRLSAAS